MKHINTLLLCLGILSLFLVSCSGNKTPTTPEVPETSQEINSGVSQTTLPSLSEEKNDIFGKDFSQTVTTQTISSGALMGYVAQPKTPGEYPGIVMIHEWWGLNDQIKYMAEVLANEGYRVFAIDLYGEVAPTQEKAGELASNVRANPETAISKMRLAYEYLKNNNSNKIASLGWCFGGQQSLNLSLNEDLDATVIYYGNLVTDTDTLKNISGPVLGIFGETDTSVKVDSVKQFQNSLGLLNIENQIHIYPGVGHAFANPTGNNFAKKETLDAWEKTLTFLKENLK